MPIMVIQKDHLLNKSVARYIIVYQTLIEYARGGKKVYIPHKDRWWKLWNMYHKERAAYTREEVRKHERRRKKAKFLGNGGPKASGDPVGAHGRKSQKRAGSLDPARRKTDSK